MSPSAFGIAPSLAHPAADAPSGPSIAKSAPREHVGPPGVIAVATALPEHRYEQARLMERLMRRWEGAGRILARIARLHDAVAVESRCLALPMDAYDDLRTFGAKNDAFIRVGADLGERAVRSALERAGLAPDAVDAVFFTTVTGIATPSLDARLANRLGLRSDVRRVPMFGLGCVGGAAGLARAADHVRGHPEHVAVLLSVELCSLTLQDEFSVANAIATGLFGDGAAAAVLAGGRRAWPAIVDGAPPPCVLDTRSAFFRDTERVMGWDVDEKGFNLVLSADVPEVVRRFVPSEVDALLARHGLRRRDVQHWISHPGGPKVIAALEESLDLGTGALVLTRRSLAAVGNMSSASVLHVLAETQQVARPGDVGLVMAMGPGFCAELVLLRW